MLRADPVSGKALQTYCINKDALKYRTLATYRISGWALLYAYLVRVINARFRTVHRE